MLISMGVIDVSTTNLSLEAGQTEDAFIILSFLIFKVINPKEYEFDGVIERTSQFIRV